MIQDLDLKYVNGVLTTTKALNIGGALGVGGGGQFAGAVDLASHKLTGVANGSTSSDAVNKGQLDGVTPSPTWPSDLGLKAWNYDPASILGAGGNTITDGTIYLNSVFVHAPMTVSGLSFYCFAAGTSMTAGANWIGLINSSGSKLAEAALDTAFTAVGFKNIAITSQSLTVGQYFVALLANGTGTDPQAGVCNTTGGNQALTAQGLTSGATLRFAVNGSGATTLPASITLSSNTTTGAKPYWVGLV